MGENIAVTIENQAAYWWNRFEAYSVALRQVGEMLVLDNLQMSEPESNQHGQRQYYHGGRDRSRQEQAFFCPVILEWNIANHQPKILEPIRISSSPPGGAAA